MKRSLLVLALTLLMVAAPAHAKLVNLTASPNPATVDDRVRHSASLGAPTRLELFVSAVGFERPGTGTLPAGSWIYRCCPSQTAGTPAWYYRSNAGVAAVPTVSGPSPGPGASSCRPRAQPSGRPASGSASPDHGAPDPGVRGRRC